MVSWGYQQEEPYKAIAECRFDEVKEENLHRVTHTWPVRPTGLYPASKVWGEAMGRYYADIHHLSVICLRIGWVNAEDHPHKPELGAIWCSRHDIASLVELAIEAPESVRFDVFYGVSNNRWCWVDAEHARRVLGYIPVDSAEERVRKAQR
jgi:nucleoside-diphosphate-sugar epimerase